MLLAPLPDPSEPVSNTVYSATSFLWVRLSCSFRTEKAIMLCKQFGSRFEILLVQPLPLSRTERQTLRKGALSILLSFSSFVSSSIPILSTCRAMGAHSLAKLHGTPSQEESALIRIVHRPTRTRSCGNLLSALTGNLGDNFSQSNPPGISSSTEPNNHTPTAAAASKGESGFNSTPSSNDSFPTSSKASGVTFPGHRLSITIMLSIKIMTLAKVFLLLCDICLCYPKSISPIFPSFNTIMLPVCGLCVEMMCKFIMKWPARTAAAAAAHKNTYSA